MLDILNALDNPQNEQERIALAMAGLAFLYAGCHNEELLKAADGVFVPTDHIANLLDIDITVIRAALENCSDAGLCSIENVENTQEEII